MKKSSLVISLLLGTTLMQGCAWTNPGSSKWAVEPFQSIKHATNRPDGYYRLGRYYQGQNRLELAAEAYRSALAIDPGFTEAHNGLGTVYAAQGKYELSLAEFKAALVKEPNAAHVYNNVGYLDLLQGNHAEAVAAFTKASTLDPANQKARNNLSMALAKADVQAKPSQAVVRAAESAPLLANLSQPAPRPPFAVLAEPNPQAMPVVTVGGKPLTATQTNNATVPDRVARPDSQPEVRKYALEISNGNGKKRFAAKFDTMLSAKGLPKASLTDHKPYNQARTVIQYRKGYGFEAARLSRHLRDIKHLAFVVESKNLPRHTDVKLILGRDLSGKIQRIDDAKPMTLASR